MSVGDWGVGHYERTAQLLLPAAEVLVGAADVSEGETVIDVGCGTGNAALLAAAAGASVTAVDPSPRLLAVAAESAAERGLEVTFAEGEAAAIPAPDAAFDCVLSNFAVVFAPDPEAAAAELSRVLTPAGRILFTAWVPGGALGAFAGAMQELVRTALGAPAPAPRFAWHDAAELSSLFSRHGMVANVAGPQELSFQAANPEAYLETELATHPLAVTAFEVLQRRGIEAAARRELLDVLRTHNEDPEAFRSTSRYLVVSARRARR
ncbi:MAG: methyltransferase domain-containing protein [Acidimicrobiales bacterium]|nr:methyltransferase domain-containing protein [Acidimicrobiales bacterium]